MLAGSALADHADEVTGIEFAAVGTAENPAVGSEAGVGEGDETMVVFFDAEDLAFVVA